MILYTSDIDIRCNAARTSFVYLLTAIFCALFGAVYERYSHGVYSFYMIYAFMLPLAGGTMPFFILSLLQIKRYPGAVSRNLYHSGIGAFTVGCIVRGILDIYGTSNQLTIIYWYAGAILIGVGIMLYFFSCFFRK